MVYLAEMLPRAANGSGRVLYYREMWVACTARATQEVLPVPLAARTGRNPRTA